MEDNEKYFERAIQILFESNDRNYRKILYKVASMNPRALVEAVYGRQDNDVREDIAPYATVHYNAEKDEIVKQVEELIEKELKTESVPVSPAKSRVGVRAETADESNIVGKLVEARCTTREMADATGVVFSTVGKWKRGEKRPSRKHSQQLHALLEKVHSNSAGIRG